MEKHRKYEGTHPWIKFDHQSDLDHASPAFWLLLGEAKSKCDHIAQVPLQVDTARILHEVYFAKGVKATTAIEGNTLSEAEVQERMQGKLQLPPSKEYLGVEVDNMLAAYNSILNRVRQGDHIGLDVETLCELNKQILAGLELEEGVVAGELRKHSVGVGNYRGAPPEDVEYLTSRLREWLVSWEMPTDHARIPFAFIKAVIAHIYIEWIHPFGDGNGRLGRLVEFSILISSGVPAPAAQMLTSHYNDTRTEYYRQLHNTSRNGGDLRPFLLYAAQGFVDGLVAQISVLHDQVEHLVWQALVDEAFSGTSTPATRRQHDLAVALGKRRDRDWVTRAQIRQLTPTLIEAYHGKTPKTLTRDLNRLAEMGFVRLERNRVRATFYLIHGMRPFVAP
jgi:Fic family protein